MDDSERRSRLLALKTAALLRDCFPSAATESLTLDDVAALGGSVAVVRGDVAWFYADDRPERALGPALAWAQRRNARRVHVLVERGDGVLARRASSFGGDIEIAVWRVDGRNVVPAVVESHRVEASPAPEHLAFASTITEGGADLVVEHGVVCGEVVGLEVCRAVTDEHTGVHRLEVGVGAHDREAFGMLHGDTPTADSLRRIVETVRKHRAPGADLHPLNRLGAERALRARVVGEPGLVDAVVLRVASPADPRPNLKDPIPCVAVGTANSGDPMVAVFSSGVDLDVVPFAADARAFHGDPDAELVIVVPQRDNTPVTQRLAAMLHRPARVVGIQPA